MLTWQDVLLRLGLAALFGLLVGAERERRAQFAGMRTMALVGVGAGHNATAVAAELRRLPGVRGTRHHRRIAALTAGEHWPSSQPRRARLVREP